MVTHSAPFIVGTDLGKTFGYGHAAIHALREVNIEIHRGDFTVVVGPSGSGKSTLLNIVGGMDTATAGSLTVGDRHLTALNARELTDYRRTSVGFVFQFYNLVPNLTAVENVALAAALVMPRADATQLAGDLLDQVGLQDRKDQFPRHLSGGEMQRVAIARALAKKPGVLLCDEPSGALDSVTGAHILAQLQRTARDTQTAVVVVTHDQSLAPAADHLIVLGDGRVVEDRRHDNPPLLEEPALT
ncbi:ABC transporter ATP-binding protein [Jonesia denitrificans]|uniref:ABC transporter related n=1 Tax=Jonesia denitrificans (strain ATCC 14870 / DSM 20603 / BCRC 15368 / CIP 55.134 / JCM 11481 / NBRC 15587 / NCTC 10816 / Prevot 55134) TaxID=471856 RepID=C7R5A6_JONDD|nr:ABC transporter ATP-binding protein [Jonesia denitrificans]ACV07784.1 ABC transporter related [Jonesia denitrificans DSM 20603]ASE08497.1 ABC transporter ATP-binding protein [Jonesia denitrificans]QXB43106.1 ABC transporter ATP-binding protein [Jonesia denitrificans]SQH19757.1 Macrolide export ATP-binding/permease protein MacB [Jonesia denitrificans]